MQWMRHLYNIISSESYRLSPLNVELHVPRFELNPDPIDLEESIRLLGLGALYENPDLPGIVSDGELNMIKLVHKTSFTVGEKGTHVSSCTSAKIPTDPGSPVFFNRPFYAIVLHRPSNTPILSAYIQDPTLDYFRSKELCDRPYRVRPSTIELQCAECPYNKTKSFWLKNKYMCMRRDSFENKPGPKGSPCSLDCLDGLCDDNQNRECELYVKLKDDCGAPIGSKDGWKNSDYEDGGVDGIFTHTKEEKDWKPLPNPLGKCQLTLHAELFDQDDALNPDDHLRSLSLLVDLSDGGPSTVVSTAVQLIDKSSADCKMLKDFDEPGCYWMTVKLEIEPEPDVSS